MVHVGNLPFVAPSAGASHRSLHQSLHLAVQPHQTPHRGTHRDPCMYVRLWRGRPLNTRTLPIGVSTATSDAWPAVLAKNLVILKTVSDS